MLKTISCLFSVFWVGMHLAIAVNSPGLWNVSDSRLFLYAVVTATAAVPILAFLRGPLKYLLGVPFALVALWLALDLLSVIEQPWRRL